MKVRFDWLMGNFTGVSIGFGVLHALPVNDDSSFGLGFAEINLLFGTAETGFGWVLMAIDFLWSFASASKALRKSSLKSSSSEKMGKAFELDLVSAMTFGLVMGRVGVFAGEKLRNGIIAAVGRNFDSLLTGSLTVLWSSAKEAE